MGSNDVLNPELRGREQEMIVQRIQETLHREDLDGMLLLRCDNIFYATGFLGSFSYQSAPNIGDTVALVPSTGQARLIVPDLEWDNAATITRDVDTEAYTTGAFIDDGTPWSGEDKAPYLRPYGAIEQMCRHIGKGGRIAVDTKCLGELSGRVLREVLADLSCEIVPAEPLLTELRKIKTPWEALTLKKAAQMTEQAWKLVTPIIVPGLPAYEISRRFKIVSAELDRYGCISQDQSLFAIGKRIGLGTIPRGVRVEEGDLVKFDAGFRYCGYTADIARTFAVGTPEKHAAELYQVLYEANRLGADMIGPGVRFCDIYRAVREKVESSRVLKRYPRSNVGHSVGASPQIGEWPNFSPGCRDILQPGMVVTLETPYSGMEGGLVQGGYNIEDCYYITENGKEQWTFAPASMKW